MPKIIKILFQRKYLHNHTMSRTGKPIQTKDIPDLMTHSSSTLCMEQQWPGTSNYSLPLPPQPGWRSWNGTWWLLHYSRAAGRAWEHPQSYCDRSPRLFSLPPGHLHHRESGESTKEVTVQPGSNCSGALVSLSMALVLQNSVLLYCVW